MTEIADFLRARIAERRALAEAAAALQGDPENGWGIIDHSGYAQTEKRRWISPHIGMLHEAESAEHIVANNPAVVIADCDAKLALIDEIEPPEEPGESETDAQLHARFAHPAWEYRTTSGLRKQWDGIDDPPCDDSGDPEPGWERNLDAGMPGEGWERFDYTEESYWRRPRPDGPRTPYIPKALRILAQPFTRHPDHKGEKWAP